MGVRGGGGNLVEALCDKPKCSGSFSDGIIGIFIDLKLSAAQWP
jgi:hypothetical protein